MQFSFSFWEPILIFSGYSAIIALGQYVSMSSGVLSVAHAALAGVGAYGAGALTSRLDVPLIPAIAAGAVAGFVVGYVIGLMAARLAPLVAGLMTLAFAEVMVVAAYNIDLLGGANGLSGVPIRVGLPATYLVLGAMVLAVWRYDTARLGIAARAVRDDPDAAAAMGIPVVKVKALTFALGGAIAAIGGALSIHYITVITPDDLSFWSGVNYLLFAVVGGSFVVWGPLAGAFLLTLLPEVLRFSQTDRFIIYGVLLTAIVILRPEGLFTRRIPKYAPSSGGASPWNRLPSWIGPRHRTAAAPDQPEHGMPARDEVNLE